MMCVFGKEGSFEDDMILVIVHFKEENNNSPRSATARKVRQFLATALFTPDAAPEYFSSTASADFGVEEAANNQMPCKSKEDKTWKHTELK